VLDQFSGRERAIHLVKWRVHLFQFHALGCVPS
jgi:hypothetical protein